MGRQYLPKRSTYTVLSAMGYFLDGYDLSVISVFTYALLQYKFWPYTSFELGFVSGAALLGAMFGALVFGHYSDRLGRRYLYVWDLLFFVVFAVLSAVATNMIEMIVFRFFVGWGVGADYSLSPVYATEMYPTGRRGMGYGWVWSFWSIGALVSFLIGYYLYIWNPIIGWRWALGLGAIPALITVLLRATMPESSRWRVAVQGTEDAVSEAKRLSVVTGLSEDELSKLIQIEREMMTNVRPGDWRWLFRGDFGRRTVIVWTQWILYDIGSYGFGLYAPAILAMLGFKGALAILLSALLYIPGFLGALGAAYLNDVAGRRVLQLIGFGGSALGMVFVAIGAYLVGLVAVIIGVIGLILWYGIGNLGPGNTMGLYAIELFPTKLRSTSMGSATAITRFVSFLSAFEFPYIALTLGKLTFFEFLVIVTFIAFIWTLFCTPETKGIPLELIAVARTKCPGLHPKLEISAVGTERGR